MGYCGGHILNNLSLTQSGIRQATSPNILVTLILAKTNMSYVHAWHIIYLWSLWLTRWTRYLEIME